MPAAVSIWGAATFGHKGGRTVATLLIQLRAIPSLKAPVAS